MPQGCITIEVRSQSWNFYRGSSPTLPESSIHRGGCIGTSMRATGRQAGCPWGATLHTPLDNAEPGFVLPCRDLLRGTPGLSTVCLVFLVFQNTASSCSPTSGNALARGLLILRWAVMIRENSRIGPDRDSFNFLAAGLLLSGPEIQYTLPCRRAAPAGGAAKCSFIPP